MKTNKKTIALWIVQGLLCAVFLASGGMKLLLSADQYAEMGNTLPMGFLRFIGVCEVAGALGLILPTALRIKPILTPIAAAGLIVIMIGATFVNIVNAGLVAAPLPIAIGILCGVVAKARWQRLPGLALQAA